ncbi:MAG TPA: hypothetical protein DGG94_20210 [Micromonosporaceae bacterium]|nr:hypothetical protein [Micromonosporaceae bacterium]HCU52089.1 hypothetical protein [Micromonosporaceae bacterium]
MLRLQLLQRLTHGLLSQEAVDGVSGLGQDPQVVHDDASKYEVRQEQVFADFGMGLEIVTAVAPLLAVDRWKDRTCIVPST